MAVTDSTPCSIHHPHHFLLLSQLNNTCCCCFSENYSPTPYSLSPSYAVIAFPANRLSASDASRRSILTAG